MDLLLVDLVPVNCTVMKLYLFLCKLLIKSSINQSMLISLSGIEFTSSQYFVNLTCELNSTTIWSESGYLTASASVIPFNN